MDVEKLAYLGIMGSQLRGPLNPLEHHSPMVSIGFRRTTITIYVVSRALRVTSQHYVIEGIKGEYHSTIYMISRGFKGPSIGYLLYIYEQYIYIYIYILASLSVPNIYKYIHTYIYIYTYIYVNKEKKT